LRDDETHKAVQPNAGHDGADDAECAEEEKDQPARHDARCEIDRLIQRSDSIHRQFRIQPLHNTAHGTRHCLRIERGFDH
jgi:hypothetical protein